MLEYSNFKEASWLRWSADAKEDAKVIIMGVPFDNAVSLNKGASKAPERLRELSVDMSDTTDDFRVIKEGLIYDSGDIHADLNWERYFSKVEERAYGLMKTDNFCLFIGGDHSVTIPLHRAFGKYQREKNKNCKIGIIHFDAHYDLCDEYDGHKWSHACTEARALDDVIGGKDLTFVGVRVAEEDELQKIADNTGITTIRAVDVDHRGADSVAKELAEHYRDYDAVYLTLDIDVLDPAYAPGTGTPSSGGLTSMQLIDIFKDVIKNVPVKAMDIVEVAPPLDVNDITAWAALKMVHEVFSHFSK